MNTAITEVREFRGEYAFLSNFFPSPVMYEGRLWLTSEHAYQAAKTIIPDEIEQIFNATTPGKAKRLGQSITICDDWNDIRIDVMSEILEAKFSIPELEEKLLSTGNIKLLEGNAWGDKFWGVDINTGIGQNMLGTLLMQIREDKRSFG